MITRWLLIRNVGWSENNVYVMDMKRLSLKEHCNIVLTDSLNGERTRQKI